MTRTFWILFVVFVAGLIILLLPDNGTAVIKLNKAHGPSSVDLAGLMLMLGSWLVSYVLVFIHRKKVIKKFGKGNVTLLCLLYFILVLGIAIGLMLSSEWMLWSCVTIAFMINVSFLIPVFRRNP